MSFGPMKALVQISSRKVGLPPQASSELADGQSRPQVSR